MERNSLKSKHGIGIFLFSLLAIGSLGFILQRTLGMYGLAITELIILGIAILPVYFFKDHFKDIFKYKKTKFSHIIGGFFLWLGAYILMILVSQITMYFFQKDFGQLSKEMTDFFTSTPQVLALIIVAVLPALCEELLHRGLIQYTLRAFKNWQIILLMAVIFGLFHLDPYRFLPTAILGGFLTYAMVETQNIIIPIFMHFVNNALVVYLNFQNIDNVGSGTISKSQLLVSIGVFLILASFVPFIILVGIKFIRGKEFKIFKWKRIVLLILLSLVISISAIGLLVSVENTTLIEPVFITNFSGNFTNTFPDEFTFDIKTSRYYDFSMSMTTDRGMLDFYIFNSEDDHVMWHKANQLTTNGQIYLESGRYSIRLVKDFDLKAEERFHLSFYIEIK